MSTKEGEVRSVEHEAGAKALPGHSPSDTVGKPGDVVLKTGLENGADNIRKSSVQTETKNFIGATVTSAVKRTSVHLEKKIAGSPVDNAGVANTGGEQMQAKEHKGGKSGTDSSHLPAKETTTPSPLTEAKEGPLTSATKHEDTGKVVDTTSDLMALPTDTATSEDKSSKREAQTIIDEKKSGEHKHQDSGTKSEEKGDQGQVDTKSTQHKIDTDETKAEHLAKSEEKGLGDPLVNDATNKQSASLPKPDSEVKDATPHSDTTTIRRASALSAVNSVVDGAVKKAATRKETSTNGKEVKAHEKDVEAEDSKPAVEQTHKDIDERNLRLAGEEKTSLEGKDTVPTEIIALAEAKETKATSTAPQQGFDGAKSNPEEPAKTSTQDLHAVRRQSALSAVSAAVNGAVSNSVEKHKRSPSSRDMTKPAVEQVVSATPTSPSIDASAAPIDAGVNIPHSEPSTPTGDNTPAAIAPMPSVTPADASSAEPTPISARATSASTPALGNASTAVVGASAVDPAKTIPALTSPPTEAAPKSARASPPTDLAPASARAITNGPSTAAPTSARSSSAPSSNLAPTPAHKDADSPSAQATLDTTPSPAPTSARATSAPASDLAPKSARAENLATSAQITPPLTQIPFSSSARADTAPASARAEPASATITAPPSGQIDSSSIEPNLTSSTQTAPTSAPASAPLTSTPTSARANLPLASTDVNLASTMNDPPVFASGSTLPAINAATTSEKEAKSAQIANESSAPTSDKVNFAPASARATTSVPLSGRDSAASDPASNKAPSSTAETVSVPASSGFSSEPVPAESSTASLSAAAAPKSARTTSPPVSASLDSAPGSVQTNSAPTPESKVLCNDSASDAKGASDSKMVDEKKQNESEVPPAAPSQNSQPHTGDPNMKAEPEDKKAEAKVIESTMVTEKDAKDGERSKVGAPAPVKPDAIRKMSAHVTGSAVEAAVNKRSKSLVAPPGAPSVVHQVESSKGPENSVVTNAKEVKPQLAEEAAIEEKPKTTEAFVRQESVKATVGSFLDDMVRKTSVQVTGSSSKSVKTTEAKEAQEWPAAVAPPAPPLPGAPTEAALPTPATLPASSPATLPASSEAPVATVTPVITDPTPNDHHAPLQAPEQDQSKAEGKEPTVPATNAAAATAESSQDSQTTAKQIPPSVPMIKKFHIGQRILAKSSKGDEVAGVIEVAHPNGTYDIFFDDGEEGKQLEAASIRKLTARTEMKKLEEMKSNEEAKAKASADTASGEFSLFGRPMKLLAVAPASPDDELLVDDEPLTCEVQKTPRPDRVPVLNLAMKSAAAGSPAQGGVPGFGFKSTPMVASPGASSLAVAPPLTPLSPHSDPIAGTPAVPALATSAAPTASSTVPVQQPVPQHAQPEKLGTASAVPVGQKSSREVKADGSPKQNTNGPVEGTPAVKSSRDHNTSAPANGVAEAAHKNEQHAVKDNVAKEHPNQTAAEPAKGEAKNLPSGLQTSSDPAQVEVLNQPTSSKEKPPQYEDRAAKSGFMPRQAENLTAAAVPSSSLSPPKEHGSAAAGVDIYRSAHAVPSSSSPTSSTSPHTKFASMSVAYSPVGSPARLEDARYAGKMDALQHKIAQIEHDSAQQLEHYRKSTTDALQEASLQKSLNEMSKATIVNLQEKIEALTQQSKQKEEKERQLQAHENELLASLKRAQDQLLEKDGETKKLIEAVQQDTKRQLDALLEANKVELLQAEEKVKKYEESLKKLQSEDEGLKVTNKETLNKVSALTAKLAEAQRAQSTLQEEGQQRVREIQAESDTAIRNIEHSRELQQQALQARISELEASLERVKKQYESAQSQENDSRVRASSLATELEKLHQESENIKKQAQKELEAALAEAQQRQGAVEAQLKEREQKLKELEGQVTALTQKHQESERQRGLDVNTFQQKLAEVLQKERADGEQKASALSKQLEEASEQKLNILREQLEKFRTEAAVKVVQQEAVARNVQQEAATKILELERKLHLLQETADAKEAINDAKLQLLEREANQKVAEASAAAAALEAARGATAATVSTMEIAIKAAVEGATAKIAMLEAKIRVMETEEANYHTSKREQDNKLLDLHHKLDALSLQKAQEVDQAKHQYLDLQASSSKTIKSLEEALEATRERSASQAKVEEDKSDLLRKDRDTEKEAKALLEKEIEALRKKLEEKDKVFTAEISSLQAALEHQKTQSIQSLEHLERSASESKLSANSLEAQILTLKASESEIQAKADKYQQDIKELAEQNQKLLEQSKMEETITAQLKANQNLEEEVKKLQSELHRVIQDAEASRTERAAISKAAEQEAATKILSLERQVQSLRESATAAEAAAAAKMTLLERETNQRIAEATSAAAALEGARGATAATVSTMEFAIKAAVDGAAAKIAMLEARTKVLETEQLSLQASKREIELKAADLQQRLEASELSRTREIERMKAELIESKTSHQRGVAEIQEQLQSQLAIFNKRATTAEEEIKTLREAERSWKQKEEQQLAQIEAFKSKAETKEMEFKLELMRLQTNLEKAKENSKVEFQEKAKSELETVLQNSQVRQGQLETAIAEAKAHIGQLETQLTVLRTREEDLQRSKDKEQEQLQQLKVHTLTLEKEKVHIEHAAQTKMLEFQRSLEQEVQNLRGQLSRAQNISQQSLQEKETVARAAQQEAAAKILQLERQIVSLHGNAETLEAISAAKMQLLEREANQRVAEATAASLQLEAARGATVATVSTMEVAIKAAVEGAAAKIAMLEAKLKVLETEGSALGAAKRESEAKVIELQQKLTSVTEKSGQEMDRLRLELHDSQLLSGRSITTLEDALSKQKQAADARFADYEENLRHLRDSEKSLKVREAQLMSQVDSVRSKAEARELELRLELLQALADMEKVKESSKVELREQAKSEMDAVVKDINAKQAQYENAVRESKDRCVQLEAQISVLKANEDELLTLKKKDEEIISSLKAQISSLDKERLSLEVSSHTSLQGLQQLLEEKAQQHQSAQDRLRSEYDKKMAESDAIAKCAQQEAATKILQLERQVQMQIDAAQATEAVVAAKMQLLEREANQRIAEASAAAAALEAARGATAATVSTMEVAIKAAVEGASAKIAMLEARVRVLETEEQALQASKRESLSRCTELQTRLEAVIAEKAREVTAFHEELAKAKEESAKLVQSLEENLRAEKSSADAKIRAGEASIQALREAEKTLKESEQSLIAQVNALQSKLEMQEMENRIELQARAQELSRTKEELLERISALEGLGAKQTETAAVRIAELETRVKRLNAQETELLKTCSDYESKVAELSTKLRVAEEEGKAAVAQGQSALDQAISEAREEKNKLDKGRAVEVAAAQARIEELEKILTLTRSEAASKESSLMEKLAKHEKELVKSTSEAAAAFAMLEAQKGVSVAIASSMEVAIKASQETATSRVAMMEARLSHVELEYTRAIERERSTAIQLVELTATLEKAKTEHQQKITLLETTLQEAKMEALRTVNAVETARKAADEASSAQIVTLQAALKQTETELSSANEQVKRLEADKAGLDTDAVEIRRQAVAMREELAKAREEYEFTIQKLTSQLQQDGDHASSEVARLQKELEEVREDSQRRIAETLEKMSILETDCAHRIAETYAVLEQSEGNAAGAVAAMEASNRAIQQASLAKVEEAERRTREIEEDANARIAVIKSQAEAEIASRSAEPLARVDQLTTENQELSEQLHSTKASLVEETDRSQSLQSQVQELSARSAMEQQEHETRVQALKQQYDGILKQLEEASARIGIEKARADTTAKLMQDLEGRYLSSTAESEETINGLTSNLTIAQSRILELEQALVRQREELEEQTRRCGDLDALLGSARKAGERYQLELGQLQDVSTRTIAALTDTRNALEAKLRETQERLHESERKVSELQQQLDAAKHSLDIYKEREAQLLDQIAEHEKRRVEVLEKISLLENTLQTLRDESARNEDTLVKQLQETKGSLREAHSETVNLKEQLNLESQRLDEAYNQLSTIQIAYTALQSEMKERVTALEQQKSEIGREARKSYCTLEVAKFDSDNRSMERISELETRLEQQKRQAQEALEKAKAEAREADQHWKEEWEARETEFELAKKKWELDVTMLTERMNGDVERELEARQQLDRLIEAMQEEMASTRHSYESRAKALAGEVEAAKKQCEDVKKEAEEIAANLSTKHSEEKTSLLSQISKLEWEVKAEQQSTVEKLKLKDLGIHEIQQEADHRIECLERELENLRHAYNKLELQYEKRLLDAQGETKAALAQIEVARSNGRAEIECQMQELEAKLREEKESIANKLSKAEEARRLAEQRFKHLRAETVTAQSAEMKMFQMQQDLEKQMVLQMQGEVEKRLDEQRRLMAEETERRMVDLQHAYEKKQASMEESLAILQLKLAAAKKPLGSLKVKGSSSPVSSPTGSAISPTAAGTPSPYGRAIRPSVPGRPPLANSGARPGVNRPSTAISPTAGGERISPFSTPANRARPATAAYSLDISHSSTTPSPIKASSPSLLTPSMWTSADESASQAGRGSSAKPLSSPGYTPADALKDRLVTPFHQLRLHEANIQAIMEKFDQEGYTHLDFNHFHAIIAEIVGSSLEIAIFSSDEEKQDVYSSATDFAAAAAESAYSHLDPADTGYAEISSVREFLSSGQLPLVFEDIARKLSLKQFVAHTTGRGKTKPKTASSPSALKGSHTGTQGILQAPASPYGPKSTLMLAKQLHGLTTAEADAKDPHGISSPDRMAKGKQFAKAFAESSGKIEDQMIARSVWNSDSST